MNLSSLRGIHTWWRASRTNIKEIPPPKNRLLRLTHFLLLIFIPFSFLSLFPSLPPQLPLWFNTEDFRLFLTYFFHGAPDCKGSEGQKCFCYLFHWHGSGVNHENPNSDPTSPHEKAVRTVCVCNTRVGGVVGTGGSPELVSSRFSERICLKK